MAKQKPPNPTGKLSGFPYQDLWEQFGDPWEPLYIDGVHRDLIDRAFRRAAKAGAKNVSLTKREVLEIIKPLNLGAKAMRDLVDKLYYFAGHYYSPRFHELDGDTPAQVRKLLVRVASTATKLDELVDLVTPAVWRQMGAVRLKMGKKRSARAKPEWMDLRAYITDLATAAQLIADEFPQFGRGKTELVLQGRWLRHSAAALETATGSQITTKTHDSAGKNYRLDGVEGEVFTRYCTRVGKGLVPKTIVMAVRDYQRNGVLGRIREVKARAKTCQERAKIPGPGPLDSSISADANRSPKSAETTI